MKLQSSSYLLLLSIFLISCNNDPVRPNSTVKAQPPAQIQEETVTSTQPSQSEDTSPRERLRFKIKETDKKKIAQHRASALNILNYRLKEDDAYMAMIEADTWEYAFVFDGEMSPPGVNNGVWVDFKKDHTYTYGKFAEQQGTGKYHYHLDRGELLMIDDKPQTKPVEWTIKSSEDVMIMIGTPTYRDNHIQMKLVRKDDAIQQGPLEQ